MFQKIHVVVGEIYPNLNSVKRLIVFGRNEPETIDVLAVLEIFTKEKEDKVSVELILILLVSVDGKDKAASFFVFGILPFRLNAVLEILNRVDPPPFIIDFVTT